MLMALRVHAVQEDAKRTANSASLMPSWFSGDDDKMTTTPDPTTEEDVAPFADREEEEAIRNRCHTVSYSQISESRDRGNHMQTE